ncbi:LamB/YcsF family protein [Saccharothrix sp. CCNWLW140]|uniref:LamB/YcsF family protein n=1 Tax=Saccharothrix sp. CCNWLW140 TaxID=3128895 RepID=UPI003FD4F28B
MSGGPVNWAAARGVAVGAHVGYPGLAGFGRRFVDVEPSVLTAEVLYQLGGLDAWRVRSVDGHFVRLRVDSLCVHGDGPGAVTLARAVRDALVAAGVPVAAVDTRLGVSAVKGRGWWASRGFARIGA